MCNEWKQQNISEDPAATATQNSNKYIVVVLPVFGGLIVGLVLWITDMVSV